MIQEKFGFFNHAPHGTKFDPSKIDDCLKLMITGLQLNGSHNSDGFEPQNTESENEEENQAKNQTENQSENQAENHNQSQNGIKNYPDDFEVINTPASSNNEAEIENGTEVAKYNKSDSNKELPSNSNAQKRGSNSFDELCFTLEKRLKTDITTSLHLVKELNLKNEQECLLKIDEVQRKSLEEKKRFDLEKKTMEKTIEDLKRKIDEMEKKAINKTCVACAKVIDSLQFCNSECLKYVR